MSNTTTTTVSALSESDLDRVGAGWGRQVAIGNGAFQYARNGQTNVALFSEAYQGGNQSNSNNAGNVA